MSTGMYREKYILAPMVRIGTLPTRLLALRYGADIVYSEELIDHKMLQTKRVFNDTLGTVDYILPDNSLVFRTCEAEKHCVVFQMGTCDPQRALKVAKMLEEDVSAIDINMGCPKKFSVDSGMGAALLQKPDLIHDILTTLVTGLSIPVTCKIRILPTVEQTIDLAKLIQSTGVKALGVHGRLRDERPRHDNHDDVIKAVAESLDIPVIANGGSKDIASAKDMQNFRCRTGAASVMVARAAQWNLSVFRKEGPLPIDDVIKEYLKLAVDYDNPDSNSKYCVQTLFHEHLSTPRGRALQDAVRLRDVCAIWDLQDRKSVV